MALKIQDQNDAIRVGVYVDGFNLYHPIHELNQPFMKWLNLYRLSEIICRDPSETIVRVVLCTAVPKDDPDKRDRHNAYIEALAGAGVDILKGHHIVEPKECFDCGMISTKRVEKQSDINVALSLILDAQDDLIDRAYLISADSDQAATASFFKMRFPKKSLIGVSPPNRRVSDKVRNLAQHSFTLTEQQIEWALFPQYTRKKSGTLMRRPTEYDPPDWWVHPENRPRKK